MFVFLRGCLKKAACVRTTVKLLRRDTPNFIIAPNLWLLNISDFSPVDYRILAVLQEWVCQHPVRKANDRWWFRLRAWVMARGEHFEHLT